MLTPCFFLPSFCNSKKKKASAQSDTSQAESDQEFGYLQVREHAQQAPQQTAVDGLSTPLLLDEQQDPVDGFTLNL